MRLLIASPCAYGLATTQFVQCLVSSICKLQADGIEVDLKMQGAESLINRGRNTDATFALKNGYNKVLFIDADMVFKYENLKLLIHSDKKIIGGTYPLKNFPITLNFNPLEEHCDLFSKDRQQDNYIAWVNKYADEAGEAEVRHVPTGFLCVDTSVLADLTFKVPWYSNFSPDTKTFEVDYDFFPTKVVEYSENHHELLSEDWGFCEQARNHGHKVYLQTKAVNAHVGTYTYGLGHHIIRGQEPLIK